MLTIFTDTDTDITPKIASEYNIKLISMPYIENEEINYPYKDSDEFDFKTFYEKLRVAEKIPTTCALSPEEYIEYFEEEFKNGNDIFYIHFSSVMTATFTFMKEAVDELLKKYPDRKFYSIDTKAITIGSYNIVKAILDYYKENNNIEEVIEYAKNEIEHYATYFFADDLKFFKKSGRVSGIAATMGSILGIKPIIHISQDGYMKNIGKEKGRKKALNKLVEYVLTLGEDVKSHRIVIGHTDTYDLAKEVEVLLKEKLGEDLCVEYVLVNPVCGCHCGPNGVGVSFYAKHR